MTRPHATAAPALRPAVFHDSSSRPFTLHVALRDRLAAEAAAQQSVDEYDGPPDHAEREILPFVLIGSSERREYRLRLLARHPYCRFCGDPIHRKRGGTLDHLRPRSQDGSDEPANLVLACAACNAVKGGRTVEQWAADIIEGAMPWAKSAESRTDVAHPAEPVETEGVA